MPSEEFIKKARGLLVDWTAGRLSASAAHELAAALESADASGYARGRAEAVEDCAEICEDRANAWRSSAAKAGAPTAAGFIVAADAIDHCTNAIRSLSQKDTRHEG